MVNEGKELIHEWSTGAACVDLDYIIIDIYYTYNLLSLEVRNVLFPLLELR